MSEKNDGGLAHPNLTMRDYFAGQALIAVASEMMRDSITTQTLAGRHNMGVDEVIAATAYEFADAMIAERAK